MEDSLGLLGSFWGPCLFAGAYVAECCGQGPAKLSDHVFPESVWKAFGEHVERKRKRRTRRKKANGKDASSEALEALLGSIGPSWDRFGGHVEAILGSLRAS